MAPRRKRQRLTESGDAAIITSLSEETDHNDTKIKENLVQPRRSLFVRSLPSTVTSSALTELFSQNYPLKHATVVLDPVTEQSKGYGFVTFADPEDAQRAKDEFQGHMFGGKKLKVEIAEPRHRNKTDETAATEAANTKKERIQKVSEDRRPPKLIVRNLPWSIKEPGQLAPYFRKFGLVKHVNLPKVKNTQAGFGFIVMRGRKNAEKALAAVNGIVVDGRTLAVDWAVDKQVWEQQQQQQPSSVSPEAVEDIDDDADVEISEDENEDVMNFMRAHADLDDEDNIGDEDEKLEDDEEGEEEEEDKYEDDDGIESEEEMQVDRNRGGLSEGESRAVDQSKYIIDNTSTLFIRNLPFTVVDHHLKEHFERFGAVRYARVVMDRATDRSRGTGFVCFYNVEDAIACFREAPRHNVSGANATKKQEKSDALIKHSVLQDVNADADGNYTLDGRLLQVSRAVNKDQAVTLTEQGQKSRRDMDKRQLYLLSEGTIAKGTALYDLLSPSEVKMREDSATQRKKQIQSNPSLFLSLTRLAIRNIPRNVTSKDLKAMARQAVVDFAKDVKSGSRAQLSKEEEARGGADSKEAERQRKSKGKGIVKQVKVVFESKEGSKVTEKSGAGRSRGYGFVEYTSHRWALMGLRRLNGHAIENDVGRKQRLIVEFAIENAQVLTNRKGRQEKSRVRANEAKEASEKGESMATKGKGSGRPDPNAKRRGKMPSFSAGGKRKAEKTDEGSKRPGLKRKREQEPQHRKRDKIIGKKRMMRKARSKTK